MPEPSAEALLHSAALQKHICAEIQTHGSISFARYFELCQYAPGLGYYSAGLTKFAAGPGEVASLQGDFVTAPELGSLFARTLSRVFAPLFQANPGYVFFELGAGTGAFASVLLSALAKANALPSAYWILERSADLRERQQQYLEALKIREPALAHLPIRWLDAPPESAFSGVIFGNEVVDALPCERFVLQQGKPYQQRVAIDPKGDLTLIAGEETPVTHLLSDANYSDGYCSEWQPQLPAWLAGIAQALTSGMVMLADYGYARTDYYHPDRRSGTLICHYQHRAFDAPLYWPGLVDLSASVDFTALAEAGLEAGLALISYQGQGAFLLGAGVTQEVEELLSRCGPSEVSRLRILLNQQLRTLVLPGDMGERMQVMTWQKSLSESVLHPVFAAPDWRHRL